MYIAVLVCRGTHCVLRAAVPGQCLSNLPQAPANGGMSKTNGNAHLSVAAYSCSAGYALSGSTSVTCSAPVGDSAWPSPAAVPVCTGKRPVVSMHYVHGPAPYAATAPLCPPCLPGVTFTCAWLTAPTEDTFAAEQECVNRGGHLITLHNLQQMQQLQSTVQPGLKYWLGLSDYAAESKHPLCGWS